MNKQFKVIFNKILGMYVVVSENTKSCGKSTKSVVAGASLIAVSSMAFAGPTGGTVINGSALIDTKNKVTTITQATNRAIINWNNFDVNSQETVNFKQPNISAVTLNRVLSASPSLIDGIIKANGNVFIVNAAGVVIGKNASINVGGLVASTLDIKNEDFMAGRLNFNTSSVNGNVLNEGNVTATNGGLVALLGNQVTNRGLIVAKEGSVFLGSGSSISLTLGEGPTAHSIIIEKGTLDSLIEAGGAIRVEGGQIVLAARTVDSLLKTIVNQTGVLEANSLTHKGGSILLDSGDNGNINIAGAIDANGAAGGKVVATGSGIKLSGIVNAQGEQNGGSVFIGGGFQGQNPSIASAKNVIMTPNAKIDVSSTNNGNGGTAVLWSENNTQFFGDIKAKGGINGGNGGQIETSGHNLGFNGTVNVGASKGTAGNILLDPDIVIIANTTTTPQDSQLPTLNDGILTTGTTSNVSVGAIEAINSGTVNITAGGYIQVKDLTLNGGDGAINLQPNVSLSLNTSSNGGSKYPGQTQYGGVGFVNSNNSIIATGTGAITIQGGNWSAPGASAASANGALFNIGKIQTDQGNVTLRGADGISLGNDITTNTGAIFIDADADQGGVGKLTVSKNISTNSGAVVLKGGNSSAADGVNVIGNLNVGTGTLDFQATSGTFNGVYRIGGTVTAQNNFTIADNVTLGGTGTIKTTGQLGFGGIVTVESGSNLTLTATSYSIAQAINGNGANITLKPANVTDDLQLGTGGSGTNIGPVLTKLNNFGNVTIGGNDLQGKVTLSGTQTLGGTLTVAAGGTGGKVDIIDGTNITTSGNLTINANSNVTTQGTANLTSSTGKVSVASSNDVIFAPGTVLKGATYTELSVGGSFINNSGLGIFDPTTPYWRLYVNNADSLLGSGFDTTTGFHRYGCTLLGGCTTGAVVPTNTNGILFKDVPLLGLVADSGMVTYGTNLGTAGVGSHVDYFNLINGDTISDAAVSGAANVALANSTLSSGGYVNIGGYNLNTTKGTLVSNMGYGFAPSTNGSIIVNKLVLNDSFSANSKVYNGFNEATGNSIITGFLTGDVVSSGYLANFSDKNVGLSKTVSGFSFISGTDSNNYTFNNGSVIKNFTSSADIMKLNVFGSIAGAAKTYDGTTNATITKNLMGAIGGDDVTLNVSNTAFTSKNAGPSRTINADVSISGNDAGNYNLTNSVATALADIYQKALSVNATIYNKTYDATTTATGTSSLNGVIGSDVVTSSITGTFNNKNVGTSKNVATNITLGGTDSNNYYLPVSSPNLTADIFARQISVNATTANKTYDSTVFANTNYTINGVLGSDVVGTTNLSSVFNDKNVGTGKFVNNSVALTGLDSSNYYLSNPNNLTSANITARALTGSLNANNKIYDATTAATGNITLYNQINGDDVSTVINNLNFSNKNVGTNKTVTANIGLTGNDSFNYVLTSPTVNGVANITAKDLNLSISGNNKIYDATTTATVNVNALNGLIVGDDVSGVVNNANFADKNAGSGKKVITNLSLAGVDATNYNLVNSTALTSADILQKQISAVAATSGKIYDGNVNAVTTSSLSGVISGDDTSSVINSSNFSDKNAGTNKVVNSSVALSGVDSGNYILTNSNVTSNADINTRVLNAIVNVNNKVYDATTAATGSIALTNTISGDDINGVTNLNFADKNVGTAKNVSGTVALVGVDSSNYVLANTNVNNTANITPKDLVVGITGNNKTYDSTTNATVNVNTLNGLISGDNVAGVVNNASFSDKNAGIVKTVTTSLGLSGIDATNYNLVNTTQLTTADIGQLTLTAPTMTVNTKTYDGTTTATGVVGQINGVIAGDNLTVGIDSINFVDKNAGVGKNVSGNLILGGTDANNYSVFLSTSATGNIDKKVIANTGVVTTTKTYDGTNIALNNTLANSLSGIISGDNVNAVVSNATYSDKNAATNKTVVANLSLAGVDSNNYSFDNSQATTTGNITPRVLNVNGTTVVNKTYDGSINATLAGSTLNNTIAGDNIVLNTVGTFNDKNAATDKTVNINYSLSGLDNTNYVLVSNSSVSTGTVFKREIVSVVSGNGQVNYVAGATPIPSGYSGSLTNTIASDNVSPSGLTFLSNNQVSNGLSSGQFSVVVGGLQGSDASNYFINYNNPANIANSPTVTLLPVANTPSQSNLTEVRQLENFIPVYANGRGIDNRARITSSATEDQESDSLKGTRATAVGVRGKLREDSNAKINQNEGDIKHAKDDIEG